MATRMALLFILLCFAVASTFAQPGLRGGIDPDARFIDNGNGTITDTLTGLMWEQAPRSDAMTWAEASDYARNLKLAGYADWRVPYRIELRGLVQDERSDYATWLNSQGFGNLQSADYWSASYFIYNGRDYGWIVSLRYGLTRSVYQYSSCLVWCVRSTQ